MNVKRSVFRDQVVIVSGSNQGIGLTTAQAFAELGAKIVLNGRNLARLKQAEQLLRDSGREVLAIQGDITRAEEAEALIEKTIAHFGRLDILINNAGVSMRGMFSELRPEVYHSVFETNVFGTTNLTIPAMPYLRESRGSIVFVSSLAGIRGLPGVSAYCASKMALRAIAESIRIEEAGQGIHVGLIQVGYTEIEQGKQTVGPDGSLVPIPDRSGFKAASRESVAKAILENVRQRRFISTLTKIGKLTAFFQRLVPGLVEEILIRHADEIARRS